MTGEDSNPSVSVNDAATIGLRALGWIANDPERAERLIALTGISPVALRTRADEHAVLAAVLGFLEAHEPDLFACAAALDLAAIDLVGARRILER